MRHARSTTGVTGALALLLVTGSSTAAAATLPNFTGLVKDNAGAVVNIRTAGKEGGAATRDTRPPALPDLPEDSPAREFFKHFFDQVPQDPERHGPSGEGSGFIVSSDGYVLTNAHVVKGADSVTVRLSDDRELRAQVVGRDDRTDVALLKVDAQGLPVVRIGDSDALEVGQWVVAIGSPFGFEHSATQGIVSALDRTLPSDAYVPLIQTDVAVNPGNSGGPLFDAEGRVVGINSQIYSRTGGYMGLSFAIPINVAMKVADQLKSHGHVTYGWLGVTIQPVTAELAESFGLERPRGALVAQVTPRGPAAKAGVKPGDVILSYDGHEIASSAELPPLVGSTPVGKEIDLVVVRQGQRRTIEVTAGQLPGGDAQALASAGEGALGLTVAELDDEQRAELGVGDRGVLVKDVASGPAARAGLREGDVILALDHKDVHSTAELATLVKQLPRERPVPMLVQRGDAILFLALRSTAHG